MFDCAKCYTCIVSLTLYKCSIFGSDVCVCLTYYLAAAHMDTHVCHLMQNVNTFSPIPGMKVGNEHFGKLRIC